LSILELVSCGVCLILAVGLINRHHKKIHIPCMVTAFVVDVTMVLYIELTRGAVASARAKMGPLMVFHICVSVAVLVLYVWQIATGIKKARGRRAGSHRAAGLTLFLFRLINLITSFMVMKL